MNQETNDIFKGGASILVVGALLDGRTADIFIDEEGIIRSIGEDIWKQYRGEAEFIIDAADRVAIPGLVNTHTHAAMTLLRGYADDMHLQEWLADRIWPLEAHLTGEDVYWGTKLACLEMIRTGTIGFNDMYFFMAEAARAVDETGMKAQLCYGFIDLGDTDKREAEIRATETLVRDIRALDNPRIRPAVGPHAPYTVSVEGLEWCASYAEAEDIGIHVHLAETEKEVRDCVEQTGMRPVALLDWCNCLSPRTLAAHGCWLDEQECTLLGERNVSVSHNPASNMKLAVNRAMPYHWLRNAGVRVTLGTDGCASNNNLDLFEEMKFAALLQKFSWNSDTLLPAGEAFAMASAAGAQALGFGPGRIEPGAPADLVLLDRRSLCMTPLHNVTSNIVYACSGYAADTVLCDGRILMFEKTIPGEEEIREKAEERAEDLVRRSQ